jgi:hypothetical protein
MDIPNIEFKTYPLCNSGLFPSDPEFGELKSKYSLPDKQQKYNKMVEIASLMDLPRILEELLKNHYERLEVTSSYFSSTGTDIVVNSNGSPLLKMEVLNWWVWSILTQQRAIRIRGNLKGSRFKVLWITSKYNFKSTSTKIKPVSEKTLEGIHIYYSGFQILPITYFEYFENLDSRFTLFRSAVSKHVVNYQKNRLKRFFEQIELLPVVNSL